MMHTYEADAFLRSILNDPSDALRRLVFADWLEETQARSNFIWAKYLRLAEDLASNAILPHERTKKARLLARIGNLVQAKLRYKAEVFVEHPEAMRRLLPTRCMILDLDSVSVPREVRDFVPYSLVQEFSIIPLTLTETVLTVSSVDLSDEARETIEFLVNRRLEWIATAPESFQTAIEKLYAEPDFEEEPEAQSFNLAASTEPESDRLTIASPVERIANMLLHDASVDGIRDITIRRAGPRVEVRFQRNGGTPLWGGFPSAIHLPLVNHFRRLARLSIDGAEEQSGIFRFHLGTQFVDVAMRIALGVSGPQLHLTILPFLTEPPVAAKSVAC
ncbi:MAG: TIGR02996 domain-containing protein [Fimbriiglobus sp.]